MPLPGRMPLALTFLCALWGLASPSAAEAAPWRFPVTLGVSGSGTMTSAAEGGGYAGLWVSTRILPWLAPELGIREGLVEGEPRLLTDISAGVRFLVPVREATASFRVAFAHQHEIGWGSAHHQMGATVFGAADGMSHRTGVELGSWFEVPVSPRKPEAPAHRLRPFMGVSVLLFPDDGGPHAYVLVEGGLQVGLGPAPRPRG